MPACVCDTLPRGRVAERDAMQPCSQALHVPGARGLQAATLARERQLHGCRSSFLSTAGTTPEKEDDGWRRRRRTRLRRER